MSAYGTLSRAGGGNREVYYLFVDHRYLVGRHKSAMNGFFGTQVGESAAIDYAQLARPAFKVFVYDCIDNRELDGEAAEKRKARIAMEEDKYDSIARVDGVHVQLGWLRGSRKGRPRQKGVDVQLAVDMLRFAYNGVMANAWLITGDLDFKPVIDVLNQRGVYVTLLGEERTTSPELRLSADRYKPLDFRYLYDLSDEAFKSAHPLPEAATSGEWLEHVPLANGACEGEQVGAYRGDDGLCYVVRSHRIDHSSPPETSKRTGRAIQRVIGKWVRHADGQVALRYFEELHGKVAWTGQPPSW